MKELAAKRAEAEKEVAALRKHREEAIGRMQDLEMTLQRSCNDQGILYGSVTQQDIAGALTELGHPVQPREVRIGQTIKRVGEFEVTVKLAGDLEATIKVHITADRALDETERDEMEFDDEGNLIENKPGAKGEAREEKKEAAAEPEARSLPTASTKKEPRRSNRRGSLCIQSQNRFGRPISGGDSSSRHRRGSPAGR